MSTDSAAAPPVKVFVSYAHEDHDHAEQLRLHLGRLEKSGLIQIWADWEIEPGDAWRPRILQQLRTADIVLLLVSVHSMNSAFVVEEEVKRAMEQTEAGTSRLIPIRSRPVLLPDADPIARLQALPPGDRFISQCEDKDSAFVEVAKGVYQLAQRLRMQKLVSDATAAEALPPDPASAPAPPAPTPDSADTAAAPPALESLKPLVRPSFWDVEIRLAGTLLSGGYSVVPPGADGPVRMELNLAELLILADRLKAGTADAGVLAQLGARLYQALFSREVRQVWEQGQKIMDAQTYLRLRLDIRAPELAALPWELLRVEGEPALPVAPRAAELQADFAPGGTGRGGYYLGMSPRRPIVRWMRDGPPPPEPLRLDAPLRIALAVEGDREQARRAQSELTHLLPEAVQARRISVRGASVRTLHDLLRLGRRNHVVHYVGRGEALAAAGKDPQELLRGAADGGALRLLVLTPRDGTPPAQVNAVLGVAQGAFAAGVPAVVAMQGVPRPEGAAAFARTFYTALADGAALESCMAAARQAVLRETGADRPDWALPVLFSRAEDGMLWEVAPPAPAGGTGEARAARRPVPHNMSQREPLPPLGRDALLARLSRLLSPAEGAVRIQLVGEGGAGRSALAKHAAATALRLSEDAPADPAGFDAIIRVSPRHGRPPLSGSAARESPWSMDDLYATVASVLGRPGMSEVRPEERMAVLKEVLQGGRFLLVLDDVDLVVDRRRDDFLRALQPPAKAVLVCRSPLPVGDVEVPVPPLDPVSSAELLRLDAAGARAVALEQAGDEERMRLARLSGGLPFVLRWVVAQLRDPRVQVDAVARRLEGAQGEPLADACVRMSVDALSPEERVLLLSFALYPQPTTLAAAAAAAGTGLPYQRECERLVQLRLLRAADAPDRLRPILRARRYVRDLLEGKERVFARWATQRAVDFVLVTAQTEVERLRGEVGNVMWAALRAYEAERWPVLVEFRRRLDDFLYRHGYFPEALLLGDLAFDAADRIPDRTDRAWSALYLLGRVHHGQGNLPEARRWSGRALALFEQEENHFGQAMACRDLARVLQAEDEATRAEAFFRRGLEHARHYDTEPDHFKLQARLSVSLAALLREQERWTEAETLYRAAAELYERAADEGGMASTWHALGTLALERGDDAAAEELLGQSLAVLRDPRRLEVRSARVWVSQARLAERRGDLAGALSLLGRARQVLQSDPGEAARIDAALASIGAAAVNEHRRAGGG